MPALLNLAYLVLLSGGEKGGLLDVSPGLIIWTVITFIFLMLILKKLAWKPILTSLNERENFIKESLEKADKAQKDAQELLKENNANLAKAEEESQKIIAQGREYAEKLKNQILEESKTQGRKMVEDATAEIERKNREAFERLKDQIADIAIDAAEKIIRENLDKAKQKTIVDNFIDQLPKN